MHATTAPQLENMAPRFVSYIPFPTLYLCKEEALGQYGHGIDGLQS